MGVEAGLEQFSFRTALSPLGVLCQPTCLIGTKGGSEKVLEGAPEPLLDAIHDYLIHQRDDLRKQQGEMMKTIMTKQISSGQAQLEQEKEANDTARTSKTTHQDKNFWQKKITPMHHKFTALQTWKEALGIDVLENSTASSRDQEQSTSACDIDAAMIESLFATQDDTKRQELIVVASLIDKLPNLAGITRTCEIFRAKKLIVGDLSIKSDPSFSKISVSADQWVDFDQVSPDILRQWLETMAQSGYQLVGLEQTEDSCPLQEFSFAPKTVLVLGAEKQGIPADILQVLHETVEIPQLGIIRSLNVHVSAAITMYEYTRQQQMK
jgi:tRNA G18 (ribose-2'-O)-methylase SpoU